MNSLTKFTWNNGTTNSPIVLTSTQIKKLIAIGQNKNITSDIRGCITTTSRKIQKILKYNLNNLFPNLTVICDEELADVFTISTSNTNIKEGQQEKITIANNNGIDINNVRWKFEYSNFNITGNISEQNIKDRISIQNGKLIVANPKENATWSVNLRLYAYPIYYQESQFASIPAVSKPHIDLTISAISITDVVLSLVDNAVSIGDVIKFNITPLPANSTKLTGVYYSYATSTPECIGISGTTVKATAAGSASITVTVHACENNEQISKTITFSIYDLRPICYIIDQRGIISDADGMISGNYHRNKDNSLTLISNSGSVGGVDNSLKWLRDNSKFYVGKYIASNGSMLLKQLQNNRNYFADNTDATSYITSEGKYDVWMKFPSNIYFKTEKWYIPDTTTISDDVILVTIAPKLPQGDDGSTWEMWDCNHLIGVYYCSNSYDKYYSLSSKNAYYAKDYTKLRSRGSQFYSTDYLFYKLIVFLFYGWYSTTNSNSILGRHSDEASGKRPTGSSDEYGFTDSNSDSTYNSFWGLENICVYNEILENVISYKAKNPNSSTPDSSKYLDDYIKQYGSITITKTNGITYTNQTLSDLQDIEENYDYFIKVTEGSAVRFVQYFYTHNVYSAKKLIFGQHNDILPKEQDNKGGYYIGTIMTNIGKRVLTNGNDNMYGKTSNLLSLKGGDDVNMLYRLVFKGTNDTIEYVNSFD